MTPIIGAVIADQYWGKYKTIVVFCGIYLVGLLVLFLTSLPISLEHGAGLGGLVVAIIIVGLGTGGIKSNVAPLIADQYTRKKMAIKTTAKGGRVIVDPAATVQRIYMIFYACVNVSSLSLLATSSMEKRSASGQFTCYACACLYVVLPFYSLAASPMWFTHHRAR